MKRNGWLPMLQGLSYLTQLGLSVAVPIILPLLAAGWLVRRFGWGSWVYLAALVLGLGAAACTFWQFMCMVQRRAKQNTKRK